MTTKRKPKPRPRKATSDRVSRIAGRYLRGLATVPKGLLVRTVEVDVRDLKALCASCLSQDETRGRVRK